MKVLTPRQSFSLDYSPKQWIGFSNTFLLILVAGMCGAVVYEVYNINKRFTTMLNSSVATIDLLATNFISPKIEPTWKEISNNTLVYSSFFKMQNDEESVIIIIGSNSNDKMPDEDLRCLIKYNGEEDITIVEAYFERFSGCSTFFVYCPTKGNKIPSKVVLISYKDTSLKRWIEVEKISATLEQGLGKPKTAGCVQPLDQNISVQRIQEFIDFYEIIGVSHFFLYDYNAPEYTVQFIYGLIDKGYPISILKWNKKTESLNNCPHPGQEYIQDCLHRALDKYSNVITVDVNDFLILREHSHINDLLETFSSYGQLQIKRAHYCDINNQNLADLSIKNTRFVGPIKPSMTNYFLHPKEKAAVEFHTSSSSKSKKSTEIISELKGVIGHLSSECGGNLNG